MGDIKVNEIKTDTIKNQAGTSAATIDSTGRILQPAVPAFSVTKHDGSGAAYMQGHITFDTVTLNRGNCWDGTNKFQAPVAGVYQFNLSGFCAGSSGQISSSTDYKGYLQKSQQSDFSDITTTTGHLAQTYCYIQSATGYFTITMAATVELAANDYVRYFVAAAYLYTNVATARYSPVFSGFLVG
tara:strand:- start:542 stop:1096 length:555 start_codon:yes stop_codon:yes gene_type:complete